MLTARFSMTTSFANASAASTCAEVRVLRIQVNRTRLHAHMKRNRGQVEQAHKTPPREHAAQNAVACDRGDDQRQSTRESRLPFCNRTLDFRGYAGSAPSSSSRLRLRAACLLSSEGESSLYRKPVRRWWDKRQCDPERGRDENPIATLQHFRVELIRERNRDNKDVRSY